MQFSQNHKHNFNNMSMFLFKISKIKSKVLTSGEVKYAKI